MSDLLEAIADRRKAMQALAKLRRSKEPWGKKWKNAGYFDVPGAVMKQLAAQGFCETRKLSASHPQEYR